MFLEMKWKKKKRRRSKWNRKTQTGMECIDFVTISSCLLSSLYQPPTSLPSPLFPPLIFFSSLILHCCFFISLMHQHQFLKRSPLLKEFLRWCCTPGILLFVHSDVWTGLPRVGGERGWCCVMCDLRQLKLYFFLCQRMWSRKIYQNTSVSHVMVEQKGGYVGWSSGRGWGTSWWFRREKILTGWKNDVKMSNSFLGSKI